MILADFSREVGIAASERQFSSSRKVRSRGHFDRSSWMLEIWRRKKQYCDLLNFVPIHLVLVENKLSGLKFFQACRYLRDGVCRQVHLIRSRSIYRSIKLKHKQVHLKKINTNLKINETKTQISPPQKVQYLFKDQQN